MVNHKGMTAKGVSTMKNIIAALVALSLFGCASDKEYAAYLTAQSEANRQAAADQKPLVRITAQPGQAITGLQSLEVFTPTSAPIIQQARPSEWAGVAQTALGVTGTVLGIHAGGIAAGRIADSVGRAGATGYQYIQAPGATTTTTSTIGDNSGANSSNSGKIAGATLTDATSTPTVVNATPPVIVTQPAPVVVQPQPGQVCAIDPATGILTCL